VTDRRDDMRAGDADRTAVANRLQGAVDEGRLSLTEYDERLRQTYAARTYGELDAVVADLPQPARPARSAMAHYESPPIAPATSPIKPVAAVGRGAVPSWLARVWAAWLVAVLVNVAIWAAVSLTADRPVYFWPIWVAGPWGAVLLATTIGGLLTGEPHRAAGEPHGSGPDQREADREQRRAQRHQRRADRYRRETGGD
jgi:uncharacterized protein DUF1707